MLFEFLPETIGAWSLWVEPLIVMSIAGALCSVIGLDRELRGKPAGLRTNMVVGVAAAAFAYLSAFGFTQGFGFADPGRVAAQVVSGIGFLGGGAIFAAGGKPHGLTTAAALWGSAAVGVATGAGQIPLAVALVGVIALVLWPLDHMLGFVSKRASKSHELYVILADLEGIIPLRNRLASNGFQPLDVTTRMLGDRFEVRLSAYGPSRLFAALIPEIESLDAVLFVSAGSVDLAAQE